MRLRPDSREIVTKAFLDNGSELSFFKKKFLDEMNIPRNQFKYDQTYLSTIIRQSNMKCLHFSGITVLDIDGNNSVEFPPILAVDQLPCEGTRPITKVVVDK